MSDQKPKKRQLTPLDRVCFLVQELGIRAIRDRYDGGIRLSDDSLRYWENIRDAAQDVLDVNARSYGDDPPRVTP